MMTDNQNQGESVTWERIDIDNGWRIRYKTYSGGAFFAEEYDDAYERWRTINDGVELQLIRHIAEERQHQRARDKAIAELVGRWEAEGGKLFRDTGLIYKMCAKDLRALLANSPAVVEES